MIKKNQHSFLLPCRILWREWRPSSRCSRDRNRWVLDEWDWTEMLVWLL